MQTKCANLYQILQRPYIRWTKDVLKQKVCLLVSRCIIRHSIPYAMFITRNKVDRMVYFPLLLNHRITYHCNCNLTVPCKSFTMDYSADNPFESSQSS